MSAVSLLCTRYPHLSAVYSRSALRPEQHRQSEHRTWDPMDKLRHKGRKNVHLDNEKLSLMDPDHSGSKEDADVGVE
jgi:hypothetical protein